MKEGEEEEEEEEEEGGREDRRSGFEGNSNNPITSVGEKINSTNTKHLKSADRPGLRVDLPFFFRSS